ncbi:hypothetical protein [Sabulicella rubraurantiaca]|uniref:hypothetical protein n=1 Tax=Sabulicella rubraurantiaca TaxID=2811429 RepID=UPI001A959F5C|nr:hypothetical protein [Sabulicella rubraurantiaca]
MAEEAAPLIMRTADRREFIEGALDREKPEEISTYFRRYWPDQAGVWLSGLDLVLGQAVNIARERDPGRALIVGSKTVLWLTPLIDDMQAEDVLAEEVNALITERQRMIYHQLGVEEEPGMSLVTYTKGRSEANRVFKGRKTRAKAYKASPSLISDIPLCPARARQALLDAIRGVRAKESRQLREANAKLSSRFDVALASRNVKAAAADRRSAGGGVGGSSAAPHSTSNHEFGSGNGTTISLSSVEQSEKGKRPEAVPSKEEDQDDGDAETPVMLIQEGGVLGKGISGGFQMPSITRLSKEQREEARKNEEEADEQAKARLSAASGSTVECADPDLSPLKGKSLVQKSSNASP